MQAIKRKTHEEYVNELCIQNPAIEAVGKYYDANTKIMHHCVIHDIYWETTPSRVLQGAGCEKCKKEKFYKTRSKSHQQYINEVAKTNPNIEVVEKYSGAKIPIKHYCKKHNIFWNAIPSNILKRCGCAECGKEKIGDKNSKSHDQYIEDLKKSKFRYYCYWHIYKFTYSYLT
ncbi:hypothetical protein D7V86_25310 [bacterium D16-51]|nr:hypothetical protein D7V96_24920 [bacterium D16-59]RKI53134.1 hypothetical protein D7V86_25310 [bacterium D16-51]